MKPSRRRIDLQPGVARESGDQRQIGSNSRIVGVVALAGIHFRNLSPGKLFPDNKRFGVFWMGDKELAAAFGLRDAFNDRDCSH